ncbi:DUF1254 domain-containing protein [Nocardia vinacea]|uniref:DUF1254 domain-containing protein n=1 Tax=Nocardia vinacea TaxID=96468 RepID=UPI0033E81139
MTEAFARTADKHVRTNPWDPGVVAAYDPSQADQFSVSDRADTAPTDPTARRIYARTLAMQAVIYGLPSVYQYASMCAQCAPETGSATWRLNTFVHSREIAGPGYRAFRVPNVDTLYSNAWVDLSYGPVLITLPDFRDRYYTLNFLDAYSNASNISFRTHPDRPRRFMVATVEWTGDAPSGATLFRVATPLMWVLMRIQVRGSHDLQDVHELQDNVKIQAGGDTQRNWPVVRQADVETDAEAFLTVLDASLRINGAPVRDATHVRQFRFLRIGTHEIRSRELDPALLAGARSGFSDAMHLLHQSRALLGEPIGSGWTRVLGKGTHGDNFLSRAVMNFVGLAANVAEENCSYNTYVDAAGNPLDGSAGNTYRIELATEPPADAFWSVTLYEADTGRLHDAPDDRYSIGAATDSTRPDQGAAPEAITISVARPRDSTTWLPCPPKPFFLVLRIYRPAAAALSGEWTPPPVQPLRPNPNGAARRHRS